MRSKDVISDHVEQSFWFSVGAVLYVLYIQLLPLHDTLQRIKGKNVLNTQHILLQMYLTGYF